MSKPFSEEILETLCFHCASLKSIFEDLQKNQALQPTAFQTEDFEIIESVITSLIIVTEFALQTYTEIESGKEIITQHCKKIITNISQPQIGIILKENLMLSDEQIAGISKILKQVHQDAAKVEFQKYYFSNEH